MIYVHMSQSRGYNVKADFYVQRIYLAYDVD